MPPVFKPKEFRPEETPGLFNARAARGIQSEIGDLPGIPGKNGQPVRLMPDNFEVKSTGETEREEAEPMIEAKGMHREELEMPGIPEADLETPGLQTAKSQFLARSEVEVIGKADLAEHEVQGKIMATRAERNPANGGKLMEKLDPVPEDIMGKAAAVDEEVAHSTLEEQIEAAIKRATERKGEPLSSDERHWLTQIVRDKAETHEFKGEVQFLPDGRVASHNSSQSGSLLGMSPRRFVRWFSSHLPVSKPVREELLEMAGIEKVEKPWYLKPANVFFGALTLGAGTAIAAKCAAPEAVPPVVEAGGHTPPVPTATPTPTLEALPDLTPTDIAALTPIPTLTPTVELTPTIELPTPTATVEPTATATEEIVVAEPVPVDITITNVSPVELTPDLEVVANKAEQGLEEFLGRADTDPTLKELVWKMAPTQDGGVSFWAEKEQDGKYSYKVWDPEIGEVVTVEDPSGEGKRGTITDIDPFKGNLTWGDKDVPLPRATPEAAVVEATPTAEVENGKSFSWERWEDYDWSSHIGRQEFKLPNRENPFNFEEGWGVLVQFGRVESVTPLDSDVYQLKFNAGSVGEITVNFHNNQPGTGLYNQQYDGTTDFDCPTDHMGEIEILPSSGKDQDYSGQPVCRIWPVRGDQPPGSGEEGTIVSNIDIGSLEGKVVGFTVNDDMKGSLVDGGIIETWNVVTTGGKWR